ncbi:MAG: methyltransferase domain-containing protein [Candidatus Portnoybacteria bacterium]|nr:methyltransferase domain-containing protein [Candidatus Portnoybacteria bacterium]
MSKETIKQSFDRSAVGKGGDYERRRWFSDALREAGYQMTKESIHYHLLERGPFYDCLELGPGAGTWTKLFLEKYPDANFDLVDISGEMLKLAKKNLDKFINPLCHSEAIGRRISSSMRSFAPQFCGAQDDSGEGNRDDKGDTQDDKRGVKFGNVRYFETDFLDFKPDKQYDLFFSSRALEYISDKKEAVLKVAGLLKSGGRGFIITKTPKYLRAKLLGREIPELHQGQIAPRKLKQLLSETGFKNIEIYPVAMSLPLLKSSKLNRLLFRIFYKFRLNFLSQFFAESYCVKFEK